MNVVIDAHGAMVAWSPVAAHRGEINHALAHAGLPALLDAEDTPYAALRRALQAEFPTARIEKVLGATRPTLSCVVVSALDEQSNHHSPEVHGYAVPQTPLDLEALGAREGLLARYQSALETATGTEIGRAIRERMVALGALPLCAEGGAYWVPERSVPAAQALADALLASGGCTQFPVLRTLLDQSCIAAVGAGLALQAQSLLDHTRSRTGHEGKFPRRFVSEIDSLIAQATSYETLLGESCDAVRGILATLRSESVSVKIENDILEAFRR